MLTTLHIQRGVTLIELMIGLVIAAILLTVGAPAISDWIQNMRIRNVADSIASGLQLTRAEAVKRNTMVRFQLAGSDNDSSWTSCVNPADAVVACPAADTIQSRDSTEGSTAGIVASTSYRTLFFNGLGRVPTISSGNNATIDLFIPIPDTNPVQRDCMDSGGEFRCMRILVSPAGQIRMCDPLFVQTSNPQGCPAS